MVSNTILYYVYQAAFISTFTSLLYQVNHAMSTVTHWVRILQSQLTPSRTLTIGHPTIAVSPSRLPNLLTSAARCRQEILTFWLSFGKQVLRHTMMLHHLQVTQIFAKQLIQRLLEAFPGNASPSLTMEWSPTTLCLGCRLNTMFGIEILAWFSRTCLRIPNLQTISTMRHLEDITSKVIECMSISCRVIGLGSKPYV